MKAKKFLNDTFYSNNVDFSDVDSVDSLTSDLYFHYTDKDENLSKISGNTTELASGVIIEDIYTTSLDVSPLTFSDLAAATQQLIVINQNNIDVISECDFISDNEAIATVSTAGLITLVNTGSATITVSHPDIVTTYDIMITVTE